jgi:ribose transport system substrate-binding protein
MFKFNLRLGGFLAVLMLLVILAACGDATSTPTSVATTTAAVASNTTNASTTTSAAAGTTNAGGVVQSGSNAVTVAGQINSALPKLPKKDKYRVGFAQSESDNPWRLAQTASMKDEAAKLGWDLVITDAGGSTAKQVSDVESLIAQKVDVIFLTPREEKPLATAVLKAKAAGIPLFLIDRNVDATQAQAGRDFITYIGSDFVKEGQTAANWLIQATGDNAKIIELEGTIGSSPANDRKKGFDDIIKTHPNMPIIASQSGNFTRNEGRQTMETLLQAHPEVTAVYAQNDEMAIGAITALEAAGRKPGKDVIVVSIDGSKDGIQEVVDGKVGAIVECNPRFGPIAFATMQKYINGEQLPVQIINVDRFFDSSNAKQAVTTAF